MGIAWESIAVALITGLLSFLGVVYTTRKQHDVTIAEVKTEIALIKKDITDLTDDVRRHNGVIERTYALEKSVELLDERQKVANHRLADLENKGE